jgi:hypothetical protein
VKTADIVRERKRIYAGRQMIDSALGRLPYGRATVDLAYKMLESGIDAHLVVSAFEDLHAKSNGHFAENIKYISVVAQKDMRKGYCFLCQLNSAYTNLTNSGIMSVMNELDHCNKLCPAKRDKKVDLTSEDAPDDLCSKINVILTRFSLDPAHEMRFGAPKTNDIYRGRDRRINGQVIRKALSP